MKPIISGSGIRGIFGRSLTVSSATDFAAAFGVLCGRGRIVVGRDTRRSGPAVLSAVCSGLMSVGCDPVDLGIVTTPTVQLEAMSSGIRGGIAITSSHNPGEWNALKLIWSDGVFLRTGQRERLMEILGGELVYEDYRGVGLPHVLNGSTNRHVEGIMALPLVRPSGRDIRVVLDVTGGAAASFAPVLMERLGVAYSVINGEMTPEGDFPRNAEPTVESLGLLSEEVVGRGADLGFAFDPDGDRLALVDERGRVIGEDYTVALAIDHALQQRPGPAVVNLSTSMLAEDAAGRHGSQLFRSPVGEVNVVEEMEHRNATIGGEGNGGVIDREFHAGRDSGVAMAYTISMLREREGLTLGEWADGFGKYTMYKTKVPMSGDFGRLRQALLDSMGEPDDVRDGLWYRRGRGWMHVRPSGTEPVVRFIAENADRSYIDNDLRVFKEAMENLCVE